MSVCLHFYHSACTCSCTQNVRHLRAYTADPEVMGCMAATVGMLQNLKDAGDAAHAEMLQWCARSTDYTTLLSGLCTNISVWSGLLVHTRAYIEQY